MGCRYRCFDPCHPGQNLARFQELQDFGRERIWCFLSHVVTAVQALSLQSRRRPRSPNSQNIVVKLLKVITQRPQDHRGACNMAARLSVFRVVQTVYRDACPIVFYHSVNDPRIVNGRPVIGIGLQAHLFGGATIPSIRIGIDSPLRLLRLGEEEPMPPRRYKACITSSSASRIGTPSSTMRCVTAEGWSIAVRKVV